MWMNIFITDTHDEHGIVIDCEKREVSCILVSRTVAIGTVGPVSI